MLNHLLIAANLFSFALAVQIRFQQSSGRVGQKRTELAIPEGE